MNWYNGIKNQLYPVEFAALFHFKDVYVHPFIDGNERTTRLLTKLIYLEMVIQLLL